MTSSYVTLSTESMINYIRQLPNLFAENDQLSCTEIGDGNLNLVFKVQSQDGQSVIVKQALPYARIVGESMPLTIDRSRIEAEAMKVESKYSPSLVPKIYHVDPDMALIIMEDLSDHVIMRTGLINKNKYPLFADDISDFLAKTLFYTSDLYMPPFEKKENVKTFTNPELCKISEDLIFTQPYFDVPENDVPNEIRTFIGENIWNDNSLKLEVTKLKYRFMTNTEALLHGDLHTGSIFVKENSTKVIDPEFAYYGPMGFDIGALVANLLLNYAAQEGWGESQDDIDDMRAYLLETIKDVWYLFEKKFRQLLTEESKDIMFSNSEFQDPLLDQIWKDTLGFAGCKMIRRIHGLAHVADIDKIEDVQKRINAQKLSLIIGKKLIKGREEINDVEDVLLLIKNLTSKGVSLT